MTKGSGVTKHAATGGMRPEELQRFSRSAQRPASQNVASPLDKLRNNQSCPTDPLRKHKGQNSRSRPHKFRLLNDESGVPPDELRMEIMKMYRVRYLVNRARCARS